MPLANLPQSELEAYEPTADDMRLLELQIEQLVASGDEAGAEELRAWGVELVNGWQDHGRGRGHQGGQNHRHAPPPHHGHNRGPVIVIPLPFPFPIQPQYRPQHRPRQNYGWNCQDRRGYWGLSYAEPLGSPCGRGGRVVR